MCENLATLKKSLLDCTICAERFAATATAHAPRPVVWFEESARILIAGQAPGKKVHASGIPFDDRSGDRLRNWLGIDSSLFYDKSRIAIVPMAFCFPGYTNTGSDLPPPRICAETWRNQILQSLVNVQLTILIGGYAQKWHLGASEAKSVTTTVQNWRSHFPKIVPLPHPSWRNSGWLRANPWFESDLLPTLRSTVRKALT